MPQGEAGMESESNPFAAGWASFLGNKGYLGDVLWELWMVVGSRNVVLPEEMTDDLM